MAPAFAAASIVRWRPNDHGDIVRTTGRPLRAVLRFVVLYISTSCLPPFEGARILRSTRTRAPQNKNAGRSLRRLVGSFALLGFALPACARPDGHPNAKETRETIESEGLPALCVGHCVQMIGAQTSKSRPAVHATRSPPSLGAPAFAEAPVRLVESRRRCKCGSATHTSLSARRNGGSARWRRVLHRACFRGSSCSWNLPSLS